MAQLVPEIFLNQINFGVWNLWVFFHFFAYLFTKANEKSFILLHTIN